MIDVADSDIVRSGEWANFATERLAQNEIRFAASDDRARAPRFGLPHPRRSDASTVRVKPPICSASVPNVTFENQDALMARCAEGDGQRRTLRASAFNRWGRYIDVWSDGRTIA